MQLCHLQGQYYVRRISMHKENDVSRQKRESKDKMIFASFFEERNPFVEE